jgi:hypothetical protein
MKNLRALKMVEMKVMQSASTEEIAAAFNVNASTVRRQLDYANRAGLVADYEDQILQGLVPLAITAFKDALAKGDSQVALEVLKGTGLLKKQTDKPATPQGDESLEIYIRKIRGSGSHGSTAHQSTTLGALVARQSLPAAGAGDVLEGVVVEAGNQQAPSPAAPGVCADGDEDCAPDLTRHVDAPADDAGSADE